MVCELLIKQMERNLGRKLTKEEKKKVEEKMHHSEIDEDNGENRSEEELVCA